MQKSLKCLIALALVPTFIFAQAPIGGFMQGKGKGNIVLSYNTESYSDVFLVPTKVNGVPVFNKVKVNSTSLFGTVGITNNLDVQVNLPYIKATGEATPGVLTNLGYQNERKGLQDVSVTLKYNPYTAKVGKGKISIIGALGLQAPMSSYAANEGLQSIIAIGNRATSINTTALLQYKNDNGFFANTSGTYSLRNGDVPDALIGEIKLGYAGKAIYADAFIAGQSSSSGTDILKEGFNGVFPATRVNYSKLGVNVYKPIAKGFGVSAGFSTVLGGRNIGAASGGYGAVIYSF